MIVHQQWSNLANPVRILSWPQPTIVFSRIADDHDVHVTVHSNSSRWRRVRCFSCYWPNSLCSLAGSPKAGAPGAPTIFTNRFWNLKLTHNSVRNVQVYGEHWSEDILSRFCRCRWYAHAARKQCRHQSIARSKHYANTTETWILGNAVIIANQIVYERDNLSACSLL